MDHSGKRKIQGAISCPFCDGTKMVVFRGTTGSTSVKCGRCGRFYLADFDSMSAEKGSAIKNDVLSSEIGTKREL